MSVEIPYWRCVISQIWVVLLIGRARGGSRGRVQGVRTPPPWDDLRFSNTTGILRKKKWFIGVEVEQETSAPSPKKNPGSAPVVPHGKFTLTSQKYTVLPRSGLIVTQHQYWISGVIRKMSACFFNATLVYYDSHLPKAGITVSRWSWSTLITSPLSDIFTTATNKFWISCN